VPYSLQEPFAHNTFEIKTLHQLSI
jgi:hypothetical protein